LLSEASTNEYEAKIPKIKILHETVQNKIGPTGATMLETPVLLRAT
jgi:hypothetical protein